MVYRTADPINLQAVGVSSVSGDGIKEFFDAVEASREEYETYVCIAYY